LRLADAIYYYFKGNYYRQTHSGYVVVTAPRGAVVEELPRMSREISYDDTPYYYYNNVYYVKKRRGYVVVDPPTEVVTSNTTVTEAPQETIVVNVPNPNGSFTPVTLQKYSDGYQGPNGEFYPKYPSLNQLKAMYAKASGEALSPEALQEEELTFQVPNANGSITKVTLVKADDGYLGPEGEYYRKKPTLKQLKKMYGKG